MDLGSPLSHVWSGPEQGSAGVGGQHAPLSARAMSDNTMSSSPGRSCAAQDWSNSSCVTNARRCFARETQPYNTMACWVVPRRRRSTSARGMRASRPALMAWILPAFIQQRRVKGLSPSRLAAFPTRNNGVSWPVIIVWKVKDKQRKYSSYGQPACLDTGRVSIQRDARRCHSPAV
jgi:hypothetical protein